MHRLGTGGAAGTFGRAAASKLASGGEPAMRQLAAEAVETGEGQLLAELRAGHSSAYAMLMRRNKQRLCRLARSILRDDAESGKGGADRLCPRLQLSRRFQGRGGPRHLARAHRAQRSEGAAAAAAVDRQYREVSETRAEVEAAAHVAGREPSPEQAPARREIGRAVEEAADGLPAAFRSVFILRAHEWPYQLSRRALESPLGQP
jgi:RNA polymerase sigma-70 factor, ECF subfamily